MNQFIQTIPVRVTEAMYDAAKLNEVEPRVVDGTKGILLGYSKEFQTDVVITMNPETGLRVWYQHNLGRCRICPNKKECRTMLLRTVDALGVTLTAEEKHLDPSKLASLAFSKTFGKQYSKS